MKLTKEIKIALVAIVGILVMYFGINFLKGMNLFSTNNAYYMTFDDIQGLGASTPIYADGYKVGTVDGMEYDYMKNGHSHKEAEEYFQTREGRHQIEYIEFAQEKYSNGETAMQFFEEYLLPEIGRAHV